jgi:hypothetical protein
MVAPPARMEREMRMGFMRITLVKRLDSINKRANI